VFLLLIGLPLISGCRTPDTNESSQPVSPPPTRLSPEAADSDPNSILYGKWKRIAFITPNGEEIEVAGTGPDESLIWEFTNDGKLMTSDIYEYQVAGNKVMTKTRESNSTKKSEFEFTVSDTELVIVTAEFGIKFARIE